MSKPRRITADQYRAQFGKRTRNKHNAQKVTLDGITLASKLEARRYTQLRAMEQAGDITNLRVHPAYEILHAWTQLDGKGTRIQCVKYEGDFEYVEPATRKHVVEDTKGQDTPESKMKRKFFMSKYPEIELRVLRKGDF